MNAEAIFHAALDKPPPERSAFLADACAGDEVLHRRVVALLHAHENPGSFLADRPAQPATASVEPPDVDTGTIIAGKYKLLEEIGEGGMGSVWMAQQIEPVTRLVALKVIKPGMDSRQVIARFEAERQALALMDHPNIAKVLDAGTIGSEPRTLVSGPRQPLTDVRGSDRPFFVMELVKGVPITRYCDQHRLTPRQRLELFMPVCHAIQHAHQKGVIHRDIKPSNVLIAMYDDKPVPKVIDFGVAKATGQQLTEQTLHTGFGAVIGTLEYMSPEQASFNQLDVDTRSDIYSLGVLLYELLAGSPPFSRKDLEKAGMLEMLRVIREQEPAKPSTKLSTAEGLPTLAANRGTEPKRLTALVKGELDWIVMKALEKDRSRRYETANGFAMDVQRYLADEPVLACPPSVGYRLRKFVRRHRVGLGISAVVAVALLLVFGIIGWTIRDRAARHRAVEARVANGLEETDGWLRKGQRKEAEAAAKRTVAALGDSGSEPLRQAIQARQADIALLERLEQARLIRRELRQETFNFAAAEKEYESIFAALGIRPESLEPGDAARELRERRIVLDIAGGLSFWALLRRASHGENDRGWRGLLALANELDNDPDRVRFRSLYAEGRRAEFVQLAEGAEILEAPPVTLEFLSGLLFQAGADDQAIRLLRLGREKHPGDFWITNTLATRLSLRKEHLEESYWLFQIALALHGPQPIIYTNLGSIRLDQNRLDEAAALFRKAVAVDPDNGKLHYNLGIALKRQARIPEAIGEFRKALQVDPNDGIARNSLAEALNESGQVKEAIDQCNETIRRHPKDASPHATLGGILFQMGELDQAIAECKQALALQSDHATAHINLGCCYTLQQKYPEAERCFRKAIAAAPRDFMARYNLANVLESLKKPDDARSEYEKAIELNPRFVPAYQNLSVLLLEERQHALAEEWIRKALKIDGKDPELWQNLGNILKAQEQYPGAIDAHATSMQLKSDYLPPRYSLAMLLVTCPDRKLHDGPRAARIMEETLALAPGHRGFQDILGLAHYRSGNWKAAVKELERRGLSPQDLGSSDLAAAFVLAMAYHRLGDPMLAQRYYDAGVAVLRKTGSTDSVLLGLKSEAEALLDRSGPPRPGR